MKKRDEIADDLISAEDQEEYFNLSSPIVNKLEEMISNDGHRPSEADKMYVRNHLMIMLAINNSCRAGVIENLTVQEYRKKIKVDDMEIIQARSHKTAHAYGAAKLVLTKNVSQLMDVYINHCRPQQLTSQRFFVNRFGQPTRCSQDMTRHWSSVTGNKIPVNPTRLRKATATYAWSNLRDVERGIVADHMSHRLSTSQMYYKAAQSGAAAIQAHNLIRCNRTKEAHKVVQSEIQEMVSESEVVPEMLVPVVESISLTPVIQEMLATCRKQVEPTTTQPIEATCRKQVEPTTTQPIEIKKSEVPRFGPKSKFDKRPEVMAEVQRVFGVQIKNGYVNKKDALAIYKENAILQAFGFLQLYDKMRRMYPKHSKQREAAASN